MIFRFLDSVLVEGANKEHRLKMTFYLNFKSAQVALYQTIMLGFIISIAEKANYFQAAVLLRGVVFRVVDLQLF